MKNLQVAFTIDFDWASEAVLEYALKPFLSQQVPITLFATHNSHWLEQAAFNKSNVEIEIHPNFCDYSSHGNTQQEVFEYCKNIRSEGIGFRCHKYHTDNDIQEYYKKQGYVYMSNICTDLQYVRPFVNRTGLIEIPIYMEDGGFLFQKHVLNLDDVICNIPQQNATIVFLFHPMHLAFNSYSFSIMQNFKRSLTIQEYQNLSFDDIYQKRGTQKGIKDLFEEIFNWTEKNNIKKVLLKNVAYAK